MTLGELLTRAALRRPEAEAVVDGARRLSYAELDARAATAARGFRHVGVGKRDRVLIALKNPLEHVVASPERRVGPDEVVPPGTKGEVIARLASDEAFAAYWNRPDADAKALRDGWYFTGDMGYVDADGDFYVAGRVDDMIISGGENIR